MCTEETRHGYRHPAGLHRDRTHDHRPPEQTSSSLTTEEVATWLKVAPSTVCRWRMAGKGPRVVWLAPTLPRYRRADLTSWLEEVAA